MSEQSLAAELEPRDLAEIARELVEQPAGARLLGLRGAARAVLVAHLVRAAPKRPLLLICADSKSADSLASDLRVCLGEPAEGGRVRAFPRHDTQPYERFSPQSFVVAQRMDVLYRWLASGTPGAPRRGPAPLVVAPWTALALRVPSRESLRARCVHLEVGQSLDRDALITRLVSAGYVRQPLVEERGELAVRGGILDLFPPHRDRPLRIELLGDQVDSIREFDAATQRTLSTLPDAVAPPPREVFLERKQLIDRADRVRERAAEQGASDAAVDELLGSLLRGYAPPGIESLAPLLQPALETALDHLPDDALVLIDEPDAGRARLLRYADEARENHQLAVANGRVVAEPDELLLSPEQLRAGVEQRAPLHLERLEVRDHASTEAGIPQLHLTARGHEDLRRELAAARGDEHALQPLVEVASGWLERGWRVCFTAASLSGCERLRSLLDGYELKLRRANGERPVWRWGSAGQVELRPSALSQGFSLPAARLAVVTDEEIFGPREKRRARASLGTSVSVEGIERLSLGGAVVHADHGIGLYRGLVQLDLRGAQGEFVRLEYQDADRLFLPVDRLNRVSRYSGSDGHPPKLDKLGGVTWERTRKRVKRSMLAMARELVSLHAARELAPGIAFSPRDRMLEEFEAAFPYEETPDQKAAIDDVLADMAQPRPMDRLVCGDVGYGKTEVAIRAAFRAALDGRQVAVLVPTTILCQQHAETFRTRFAGYPVRIETLSRFSSRAQAKETLHGLASGRVDVVIGTHRLLQKSVRFRDLGLLVVDEEHRFGVTHKERIKQLRKTLDVLTLTATPIPRTLQLSLTELRSLSVIETPPADRMAIRTQVCNFSADLVREVILREVRRGGQVFYVHNHVRSIGAVEEMLARSVPEVKVLVAHGQMRERELEKRMLAFVHGEADVLLCTTIVESGLDLPRANTIVIDRADRLGLAQIYQLRGRVGRSRQRAYAYLLIPGGDVLSSQAERRLDAIQQLTELGSGFRLANLDLEIRGAGNLLGAEQSGNLEAVGYDTYMEMLQKTLDELRGKVVSEEVDPEIRLPVSARLPEDYVPSENQRLVLYKRLASCRNPDEVDRIRDEILDRFGPLPAAAEQLLEVIHLKIQARELGIAAVDVVAGELVLTAAPRSRIDPHRLLNLLSQAGARMRVTPDQRIYAAAPRGDPSALPGAARQLLRHLATPAPEAGILPGG